MANVVGSGFLFPQLCFSERGRFLPYHLCFFSAPAFPPSAKPDRQTITQPLGIKRNKMNSQEFNSNWIARVDWEEIHTLLGYNNLVNLLDDCADKIFDRLNACKAEKLTVRPFHGAVITFYRR